MKRQIGGGGLQGYKWSPKIDLIVTGAVPYDTFLIDVGTDLRHRYLVAAPVENGRIVVDILDLDRNRADTLQGGPPTVARLHNNNEKI